jgi:hypothetical protein
LALSILLNARRTQAAAGLDPASRFEF